MPRAITDESLRACLGEIVAILAALIADRDGRAGRSARELHDGLRHALAHLTPAGTEARHE